MNHKDDRAFMRQFTGVIVAFMVLTVVLIFVARAMHPETESVASAAQAALAAERIAPVGAVRSGEAGAAALAEAQAAAAAAVAAPAEPVEVSGESVYNGLCMACHAAGVSGAPIPGSDELAARLSERGLDGLVNNAINGLNAMPARGGNPALTDDEIRAAVEFMTQ
ncbi:MAG: c-type cytochrome [Xanthomonadales bacterium]